jgi:hypothetical protein
MVARVAPDPVRAALDAAAALLEELAHGGLATSEVARSKRAAAVARKLDAVGLRELAARMDALDAALSGGQTPQAAEAWLEAGVWAALSRELG